MKKLILTGLISMLCMLAQAQTATYDIVFTSNWEAHGTLPGSAHFTELVGATHNDNITFLELGGLATSGIEQVAETGAYSIFNNEVDDAITANNADQFIEGPSLFFNGSLRTITISDLEVSLDFPLVSLVSMLAPSPDWMVAVNSVSLLDNNGEFIPEITMDLFTYDAGTEDGTGYSLSNPATNPHQPIAMLTSSNSPLTNAKIGTIVFTQKSLSVDSFQINKDNFTVTPNPTQGLVAIKAAPSSQIVQMDVFNMLGKRVKEYYFKTSKNNYDVDLTELGTGIYFLRTYNQKGKTATQKIILR